MCWKTGVAILQIAGESEKQARAFLGKFAGMDERRLIAIIQHIAENPKADPKAFIAKAMQSQPSKGKQADDWFATTLAELDGDPIREKAVKGERL